MYKISKVIKIRWYSASCDIGQEWELIFELGCKHQSFDEFGMVANTIRGKVSIGYNEILGSTK